jgi:hypothetical protein
MKRNCAQRPFLSAAGDALDSEDCFADEPAGYYLRDDGCFFAALRTDRRAVVRFTAIGPSLQSHFAGIYYHIRRTVFPGREWLSY